MKNKQCYLYTYENQRLGKIYIGIGNSPSRVWEHHNADALTLLAETDTQVKITPVPFANRAQARKAEAIAIHVASLAGLQVLTNRAGTTATSELTTAVYRREGVVHFKDLTRTCIVVLKPDPIGDRPALHGGQTAPVFVARAREFWGLGRARRERYDAIRLIAIQKSVHTILGDWNLDSHDHWTDEAFALLAPDDDDPRGARGKTLNWDGYQPGTTVTWSNDIRPKSPQR